MLTRLILVVLIIVAVGFPFVSPHLPFLSVEQPEKAVEKPPFGQEQDSTLLVVGVQAFQPFEFQSTIDVTAATAADKTRTVRSDIAGEIEMIGVVRGDLVGPGKVLARVAAETRTSQSAQAEANLEQALADLESTRKLVEQGVFAQNRLLSAEAVYQSALAAVDQSADQLRNLEVTSSISGIVTDVHTEEGTTISPGEAVATIIALDPIKVIARVSETEIANVNLGQEIEVELVTGEMLTANVRYIAPSANITTRTFEIEAEAANPDYSVRDGVTATVKIPRPSEQAFEIPQSALVTDEEGRLGVRAVDQDSLTQFVPVTLIETTLESALVTGLQPGMPVMVVGQRFAEVGDKVIAKDIAEILSADEAVDTVLSSQE